ncbi:MAG: hypothetical protein WD069_04305 [Planctomycetales bacterium]
MAHDLLDDLRMHSLHRQPSPACMPQGVEVEMFPFMVLGGEEVALLAPGVLVRILHRLLQPLGSGGFEIGPQHRRQFRRMRHGEQRGPGQLRPDMLPEQFREVGGHILPGVLPVLRRAGLAGDVGAICGEEQPAAGQAPQFVRSKTRRDRRAVEKQPLGAAHSEPIRTARHGRFQPAPLLGEQHSALPLAVRLGIRLAHRCQRIARELVVRGEPLREALDRAEVRRDGSSRRSAFAKTAGEPIDLFRGDVADEPQFRLRGDRPDVHQRVLHVARGASGRAELRLVIGKMLLDRPARLLRDSVQRRIDDPLAPQRRVGFVLASDPLGRRLVRRFRALDVALPVVVVPTDVVVPIAIVLATPLEDRRHDSPRPGRRRLLRQVQAEKRGEPIRRFQRDRPLAMHESRQRGLADSRGLADFIPREAARLDGALQFVRQR